MREIGGYIYIGFSDDDKLLVSPTSLNRALRKQKQSTSIRVRVRERERTKREMMMKRERLKEGDGPYLRDSTPEYTGGCKKSVVWTLFSSTALLGAEVYDPATIK